MRENYKRTYSEAFRFLARGPIQCSFANETRGHAKSRAMNCVRSSPAAYCDSRFISASRYIFVQLQRFLSGCYSNGRDQAFYPSLCDVNLNHTVPRLNREPIKDASSRRSTVSGELCKSGSIYTESLSPEKMIIHRGDIIARFFGNSQPYRNFPFIPMNYSTRYRANVIDRVASA